MADDALNVRPLALCVACVLMAVGLLVGFWPVRIINQAAWKPDGSDRYVSCGLVWSPDLDKVGDTGASLCAATAGPRAQLASTTLVAGLLVWMGAPSPRRRRHRPEVRKGDGAN